MVTVRRAVAGDGPSIGAAHAEAWIAAYAHVFEPEFLAQAAEGRRVMWPERLAQLLTDAELILVAERDGEAVAFVHAGPAHDDHAVAEIYGFYAHPAAWGSGAASALMSAVCAELAPDWREVMLWTMEAADRARRFYEKSGFVRTARTKEETLTDWTGGESVTRQLVEYRMAL